MPSIDLNADVGESFGAWAMGDDCTLIKHVTSANIACGFHAGDPGIMRATIALAREHHVAIGAHPGFDDFRGFGRRELRMAPQDVEDIVVYQVAALAGMAAAQGVTLRHVKPHGAMYNMAARDRLLADAIARAVATVDRGLVLVGLSGSALIDAGVATRLTTASEVFADRAYEATGSLAPRSATRSVLTDPGTIATRVVGMVLTGTVAATDGSLVRVRPDTLCIHGDTPGAASMAAEVRKALDDAGIAVTARTIQRGANVR